MGIIPRGSQFGSMLLDFLLPSEPWPTHLAPSGPQSPPSWKKAAGANSARIRVPKYGVTINTLWDLEETSQPSHVVIFVIDF